VKIAGAGLWLRLLVLAGGLQACTLVDISENVSYRHDGLALSGGGLDSVVLGKTDKNWLLSHAGQPDIREQLSEVEEQWAYVFEVDRQSRVKVFPFYSSRRTASEAEVIYFQLRNGVVVKTWQRDSLPAPAAAPAPQATAYPAN
jgi:hypothetical protein